MHLPNDHTMGIQPGRPTPRAMVADNDVALGHLVDIVSHSRYWPETAILVVEGDAQDGPDHVDAHRSPLFVISPYVRRGTVEHARFSTVWVLENHRADSRLTQPYLFRRSHTQFARGLSEKRPALEGLQWIAVASRPKRNEPSRCAWRRRIRTVGFFAPESRT